MAGARQAATGDAGPVGRGPGGADSPRELAVGRPGTSVVARARTRAVRAASIIGELLVPRACVTCDAHLGASEPGLVCAACLARIRQIPAPRCDRCGHTAVRPTCTWCALLPPFVRAARSVAWVPGGIAGDLTHKLKYEGWTALAAPLGERMARLSFPLDVREERSMLVPVPLAPARRRERGYNQSELLAHAVAAHWRIPVVEALSRSRATVSQTRLTPGDRRSNVAGAFTVAIPAAELGGRHVVLVDDVVTTAATLNACAAALHAGGARIITYVTFGRARAAGDAP